MIAVLASLVVHVTIYQAGRCLRDVAFYPYMYWHVIVMIVTMASYCVRKGFMMQCFISIGVFMHSTHDGMIFFHYWHCVLLSFSIGVHDQFS
jgi:hypothetical protein